MMSQMDYLSHTLLITFRKALSLACGLEYLSLAKLNHTSLSQVCPSPRCLSLPGVSLSQMSPSPRCLSQVCPSIPGVSFSQVCLSQVSPSPRCLSLPGTLTSTFSSFPHDHSPITCLHSQFLEHKCGILCMPNC